MRRAGIRAMSLAVAVAALAGAAAVAPRHHDCADVVADAFVHQRRPDLETSPAAVLHGRLVIVRDTGLGSGAWVCLATDKQDELSAAGIRSDASLSEIGRASCRERV